MINRLSIRLVYCLAKFVIRRNVTFPMIVGSSLRLFCYGCDFFTVESYHLKQSRTFQLPVSIDEPHRKIFGK